jgi:hypothetical protein
LVVDQLNLEKLKIPTVTVASNEFISLAEETALSQGAADMSFSVVPHPMALIPLPEIREKADNAFPEILKGATQWIPTGKQPLMKSPYPAEHIKLKGTLKDVNKSFFKKGWSMGLPIIPPTPECVEEMMEGTNRKPDEVIGIVPPRMGVLTIEMVAVHAAMADCKPEYMPVLITAMEGLFVPEANWRGASTTTGTTAILAIVNGPIVKEIGLAYSQGAAGKGHHANAAIGYAMNLITYTVGGSKPPSPDKGTFGAPSDFMGWIFGENEDALPKTWNPYHLARGFKRDDNVVTIMGIYPPIDNIDHWSITPEEHVNWWAHLVTPMINMGGPCYPQVMGQPNIIGMGPEHAHLVAGAGWTKGRFAKAFWEQARIPVSAWPKGCNVKLLEEDFGPVTADTLIPITSSPDLIHIVIAGGVGKHSHYFAPFPGCLPVSRLVRK